MTILKSALVVLLALSAGACASGGSLPGGMGGEPSCTLGQTVLADDNHMRLDILVVMEGAKALDIADKGKAAGDYGLQLYRETKSGSVSRLDQDAVVTVRMYGDAAAFPSRMAFLGGNDVCRGTATVRKVTAREVEVTFPVRAGTDLGQAGLMIPRAAARKVTLACATLDAAAYVPKLDAGPARGMENTTCGLPGSGGKTRFMEAVARGDRWILMTHIKKRVKSLVSEAMEVPENGQS